VTIVEPQTILCDHIQLPSKRTPRLPIHRMRMACCVDVWTCFVNRRVYRESCGIDGLVALDDLTGFRDEDKVRNAYLREVRAEGVQPWKSLVPRRPTRRQAYKSGP
jgi:hypothetical protein